jgi:hypothetical protein
MMVSFPKKVCLIQLYSLGIIFLKYAVFSQALSDERYISVCDFYVVQCSVRGCESTVYFCTLFNESGNNEGHIAAKGKDIGLSRNGMHLGGTGRGIMTYCLVICIKVLRKATKDIRQDTMFRLLPYTRTSLCPV